MRAQSESDVSSSEMSDDALHKLVSRLVEVGEEVSSGKTALFVCVFRPIYHPPPFSFGTFNIDTSAHVATPCSMYFTPHFGACGEVED